MNKIANWLKSLGTENKKYAKPQKFVDIKRSQSTVSFIYPGHPLYDNIVAKEQNQMRILAPNETAYDETSLTHNFVAIVSFEKADYLVINSFKHFKEQSIGGLLQFDENIYTVIPFFENEEEYQTAGETVFSETYEYDHPVETYALAATEHNQTTKLSLKRGKLPLTVKMIDEKRDLFTQKLSEEQIALLDYIVIPALNAYLEIRQKRKSRAS